MPRDYAKYFTCVNFLNHHSPLRQVLALSSPFVDENMGRGVSNWFKVIYTAGWWPNWYSHLVSQLTPCHTSTSPYSAASHVERWQSLHWEVKGPEIVQGIDGLRVLPSSTQMLLPGQNFHCAVLVLHLAQLVQRGQASVIPASLLAGLASFDSAIYLCQEFSFEFLPACLSMFFISNEKKKIKNFSFEMASSIFPFSSSFLTVLDSF